MFWRRKTPHEHRWEYYPHKLEGWRFKLCRTCGKTAAY